MWNYEVKTGILEHNGIFVGIGYSGKDPWRNVPAAEDLEGRGPVPRGLWEIGTAFDHPHLGPCVMLLVPQQGTNTFHRSGFFIHGDNKTHDASHGCIILGPLVRAAIAKDPDRQLTVE